MAPPSSEAADIMANGGRVPGALIVPAATETVPATTTETAETAPVVPTETTTTTTATETTTTTPVETDPVAVAPVAETGTGAVAAPTE